MRWEAILEPEQSAVQQLQKELGVSSIIAALLVQRGMHTFDAAKAFLDLSGKIYTPLFQCKIWTRRWPVLTLP